MDCGDQLNRRDFVAASAVAGLCVLGAAGEISQALGDPTTQPSTQPSSTAVDVGAKSSYDKDGATMKWARSKHFIVMRENGKIYAMSSRCTHKGCVVSNATDHLHCRCHNSDFAYDGTVMDGPADWPLDHYGISVNDKGHVMVDPTVTLDQTKWADPGSFVAVG
jgi:Rieske Fe-S protein